MYRKKYGAVIG